MVFKLAFEEQKIWKKLRGYELPPLVLASRVFIDGKLLEVA